MQYTDGDARITLYIIACYKYTSVKCAKRTSIARSLAFNPNAARIGFWYSLFYYREQIIVMLSINMYYTTCVSKEYCDRQMS